MRARMIIALAVCVVFVVGLLAGPAAAGSQITHSKELIPSDGLAGDQFGAAVDTDGTWALIGAPGSDAYGATSGAVYVSAFNGTRWSSPYRLDPWDSSWQDFDGARFGYDVSVDGQWAVVGAQSMDSGTTNNSGAIYIYRLVDGQWEQSRKFTGPVQYSGYGDSVVVDGDTVAVAAPDMNEASRGRIYIYKWNGSGWSSEGYVMASDVASNAYFGRDLDLSGDTLVVDHNYDDNVHVFTREGSAWTEQAILSHSDPSPSDNFGAAVAIDGGTIAVGNSNRSTSRGEVFVFNGSGASWSNDAVLSLPVQTDYDRFGRALDIDDGKIAVGTPGFDDQYTGSGATWVFSGSGSDWTRYPIINGQVEDNENWGVEWEENTGNGTDVAVSGDAVFSGAPNDGDDPATTRTGSVHVKMLSGDDASTYTDSRVSVTFNTITEPGFDTNYNDMDSNDAFEATRLTESVAGLPTGYVMTDNTLVDLWTNVSFSGTFTVTIPYDDDNVPNWLNEAGPVAETDLRMLHHDGESWADITQSVDTEANTVSGVSSSFSEFVIAEVGTATASPYASWETSSYAGSLDTPHKDYQTTTRKCQVCHAVHNANPNGELLLPTTVENACVYCHITTSIGGIVIYGGNVDNYLNEDDYGHQVAGGVACVDCHSVHGANTIGGDQGLESKILRAGGYQEEFTTMFGAGDEATITAGGPPGSQRWGDHQWVERQIQQTAFCTRCHEYYSHTSTETVGGGWRTHPLRDYFVAGDPTPTPDTPDRFGLGVTVADHTTRGCTYFCHEAYVSGVGDPVDLGVGVHDTSLPHYTPDHDKFLMADDIPATDSTADEVCFECHFWGWPTRDTGVGVDY